MTDNQPQDADTVRHWAEWADRLAFILRDLVTDEEIGAHAEGELWARAHRAVAEYDAEACCGQIPCAHIDGSQEGRTDDQ